MNTVDNGESGKKILEYVVISYIGAYLLDVFFYSAFGLLNPYTQADITSIYSIIGSMVWGLIRMYIPTFSVVLILYKYKNNVIDTIRSYIKLETKSILWYLLSPLFVFFSILIYIGIALVSGFLNVSDITTFGYKYYPSVPSFLLLIILTVGGYIASITINSFYALGEEIGWRGFLYRAFITEKGVIYGGILIGIIWGFWHTPIVLLPYASNMIEGIIRLFFYVTWVVVISIFFNIVRTWSKSILATVSIHGALNAIWGVTMMFSPSKDLLSYVVSQIISVITWLILDAIIYFSWLTWGDRTSLSPDTY